MFSALKQLSDKLEPIDKITHSSKLSLISMVFILAAIPVTVIAAVSYRSLTSQAASGQPDQLKPTGQTNNKKPIFSWSCFCFKTSYRVYLRQGDNQFWSNNYWYKDVAGTSADYAGWKKNGNYQDFSGFQDGTYFWTVGCTPGYGACNNAAIASFTLDTIPPSIPTGLTSSANSFGSVTLNWSASAEKIVSYNVYRSQRVSLDTGFSQNTWACQASFTTYCTDTLFEGTLFTYYYVNATDPAGNTSALSQPLVMNVPNNDLDKDGFFDPTERYIGTAVKVKCGYLAWPPDFDNNGRVDSTDQQILAANFGSSNRRYDLNADGNVNSADQLILNRNLGKIC